MRFLLMMLAVGCLAAAPFDPKVDTIKDVPMLLRSLPEDAAPVKGEWDEFSEPKANKWFESLADAKVELKGTIESVSIDRLIDRKDPNSTDRWRLTIRFAPEKLALTRNASATLRLIHVPIVVDEPTARASKGWKKGETITLTGLVEKMRLERYTEPPVRFEPKRDNVTATIWLHVKEMTVASVGKWKAN